MSRTLPSTVFFALILAAAALAGAPATAEEPTAPAATPAAECDAAPAAPTELEEALFLTATVSTPLGGLEAPAVGNQPEPLFLAGGEPCNDRRCGARQFCCNFSCSICAPEGGFCTQQICE